jgi:hypothetical protein
MTQNTRKGASVRTKFLVFFDAVYKIKNKAAINISSGLKPTTIEDKTRYPIAMDAAISILVCRGNNNPPCNFETFDEL